MFRPPPPFTKLWASRRICNSISVILLDHQFYATFTDKTIIDAKTTSGALLCLTFDKKAAVDSIHAAARKAGGREPRPIKDQGFMYGGAFEDPDGHTWETGWMDPAMTTDGPPAEAAIDA